MFRDILLTTVDSEFRKNDLVLNLYNAYKKKDVEAQKKIHGEYGAEIERGVGLDLHIFKYIASTYTAFMMLAEEGKVDTSILTRFIPHHSANEPQEIAQAKILYLVMGYMRGGHSPELLAQFEKSNDDQVIWNLALSYISCGKFKEFKRLHSMHDLEHTIVGASANIYEAIDLGFHLALSSGVCVNLDGLIELISCIDNKAYRGHLVGLSLEYIPDLNVEFVLAQADKNNRLMKEHDLDYDQIQALKTPNARIWLLQGQQLVQSGQISLDAYFAITCSLVKLPINDSIKIFEEVNKKLFEDCASQIENKYYSHYFPIRLFYYPSYQKQIETNEERYNHRINFKLA